MFETEMHFPGSSVDDGEPMVKEPVARQSTPKDRGRSSPKGGLQDDRLANSSRRSDLEIHV